MIFDAKKFLDSLDGGVYKTQPNPDIKRSGIGLVADLAFKAMGTLPSDADIAGRVKRLAVSMGMTEKQFEFMPATHRLALEQYAVDTWALSKLMEAEGICAKGANSDTLQKFYSTTSSTILFPAFVESQIMLGILQAAILPALVATETNINSHTYQGLRYTDVEADQQMAEVGEGAELPVTKITTAETAINLKKFGRVLKATYEALRLQRINLVSIHLQRMGIRLALDETDWAIQTLIAGDGNTGSNITNANDIDCAVQGTLTYADLVNLDQEFPEGYDMTAMVTRKANVVTMLNMAEFKDPMAGFSYQRTGAMPGPFGATLHKWDSTGATNFPSLAILAVDGRYALEQVTEQGLTLETDKLITSQWERIAMSKWTGFSKLDYDATQVLDVNAQI